MAAVVAAVSGKGSIGGAEAVAIVVAVVVAAAVVVAVVVVEAVVAVEAVAVVAVEVVELVEGETVVPVVVIATTVAVVAKSLNLIISVSHYLLLPQEDSIKCVFSDGHCGEFPKEWLYKRRMTPEGKKERTDALYFHKTRPWPKTEDFEVQRCTWKEVNDVHYRLYLVNLVKISILNLRFLRYKNATISVGFQANFSVVVNIFKVLFNSF